MTFSGVKTSLRKRFGLRVKTLRQATRLSQEAFADRCGFARSYMSRIERGGANPSLDAIETLADALGVDVVRLFASEESSRPASERPEVPFASDDSYFSPSIFRKRSKKYEVGGKGSGNVERFDKFEDALAYLQAQRAANKPVRWWRPNTKGNWGLVTAVRWAPIPTTL